MEDDRKKIVDADSTNNVVVPIIKSSEFVVFEPPIGRGSFGSVYKGKCRGKDVAVKVLDGIEWDETVLDEFIQEIEIMARLLHPNILLCMGACTENVTNYAMIMEFMPRGDLHSVLHNQNIDLSLPRKIQFGIEICQGMAWLQGRDILHRDLKPANILLDQYWTCKICDFGLSQINRSKKQIRDEDEAPGSVLWMAPEVLTNKPMDWKIDVYSFGLVLWEILTRQELFAEYSDKEIFTEDIARKGIRPPLDNIDPQLTKIVTSAWDHSASKRPSWEQLVDRIERTLIDIYLPTSVCPNAGAFWEKHYKGKTRASLSSFTTYLSRLLGNVRGPSPIEVLCIKELISAEENGEAFVSIEKFSSLLKWFGPIRVNSTTSVLDRLQTVMKEKWFFGNLSASVAEDRLSLHKKSGVFLVRLNLGGSAQYPIEKTAFTLSRSDLKGNIHHTRIYFRETGGFLMQIKKGSENVKIKNKSTNIEDFINHISQKENKIFSTPCPGWPYGSIFSKRQPTPYDEPGEDSD